MTDRAPQSRYCSDAHRQAGYRLRSSSSVDEDDEAPDRGADAPTVLLRAPTVASVKRDGDQWAVCFVGGLVVRVAALSEGQARSRARFTVARPVR